MSDNPGPYWLLLKSTTLPNEHILWGVYRMPGFNFRQWFDPLNSNFPFNINHYSRHELHSLVNVLIEVLNGHMDITLDYSINGKEISVPDIEGAE